MRDSVTLADSRFAPIQCEKSLQSNAVPHWLGVNPESALIYESLVLTTRLAFKIICICQCLGAYGLSSEGASAFMMEISWSNVNVLATSVGGEICLASSEIMDSKPYHST